MSGVECSLSLKIVFNNPFEQPPSYRRLYLVRTPSNVGGEDEARVVGEGGVGRLGIEDVKRESGEVVFSERGDRGLLVEHFAAGCVDDVGAAREHVQLAGTDHRSRFGGQRYVEREDVGGGEEVG